MRRPEEMQLRLRAAEGAFLYDCHARAFAAVDHGHAITAGFVPLFLSRLYGVKMAAWQSFIAEAVRELARLDEGAADAYVRAHAPRLAGRDALDLAMMVYPSVARYIEPRDDAHAPFALREEFLWQDNVALVHLEGRDADGAWTLLEAGARELSPALVAWARGRRPHGDGTFARFLAAHPPNGSAHVAVPGVYLLGHSALLVRGRRAGLVVDPVLLSPIGRAERAWSLPRLRPLVEGALLTHAHFDHYHVPTLLALGDGPLIVPHVPRASIVCEDVAARLRGGGAVDVRALAWGEATEIGDLRVRVLPFVGEQFLTADVHPNARNWGNCYALETDGWRALVVADAGFEPGRSILDVVRDETSRHGPFDVVLAQSIGLVTTFGDGDPDLQITALTCANRAGEAVELLRSRHRVTLSVEDLPSLCAAAQARTLVLYGNFVFDRGEAAVAAELVAAARAVLAESPTKLIELRIGEGIGRDGGLVAIDG